MNQKHKRQFGGSKNLGFDVVDAQSYDKQVK